MRRFALPCLAVSLLLLPMCRAFSQVSFYHSRANFTAALSNLPQTDDFESYAPGDIAVGDVRGDFRYTADSAATQPAVVSDGGGGQALGGSPFDVFVGGDSVTLMTATGLRLAAFGADFFYAPSFDTIAADTYRLGIRDGLAAGQFAGNPDSIDPNGGSFFLGLIVNPGYEFTAVDLFSVQLAPNFLVPAYQVDNPAYTAVPEPGAPAYLLTGSLTGAPAICRARCRLL